MSNKSPKWVKVETPFKGKDFEKLIVTPVTRSKKYLWGLWSRSETEIYYFVPSGFYRLDGSGATEESPNQLTKKD